MTSTRASPTKVRTFVALDFDAASVRKLESVGAGLRSSDALPATPRLHWAPRTNLHMTLKFLGEIAGDVVSTIAAEIPSWAAAAGPFRLPLRAATAFPSLRKAEVIVSIIADDAEFVADLATTIADAAEMLGVPREARPFRPHVTLAHSKTPFDARAWLAAFKTSSGERIEIACPTLALYRSDPVEHGSMYTAIARAPLRT